MKRNCEYCRNMEEPLLRVIYLDHLKKHAQHCSFGYNCPHNLDKDGKKVDEYPNHKDTTKPQYRRDY